MVVIEWWFWFIIIMILLSRTNKKKHLNIIKRKKGGRKRKMPTELIKDFIGEMCTITVFNEFAVKGKIIAAEENWIKIETKNDVRIINGDMITSIVRA